MCEVVCVWCVCVCVVCVSVSVSVCVWWSRCVSIGLFSPAVSADGSKITRCQGDTPELPNPPSAASSLSTASFSGFLKAFGGPYEDDGLEVCPSVVPMCSSTNTSACYEVAQDIL